MSAYHSSTWCRVLARATARLVVVGALSVSMTPGCLVVAENPNYCANSNGNSFCSNRYGAGGPSFCLSANDACLRYVPNASKGNPEFDGCLDAKPDEDACYSPCGGRTSFDEDGSCIDEDTGTDSGIMATSSTGEESTSTNDTTPALDTTAGMPDATSSESTSGESSSSTEGTTSSVSVCDNGVLEDGEDCDRTDLGGETCESQGHGGGTLACSDTCSLDLSGCAVCGNGVIELGELCEGTALGEIDCEFFGFDGGTLACAVDCSFYDFSGCTACGDGSIGGGEVCEPGDLDGETCESIAGMLSDGELACNDDCAGFDTSGCHSCGNQSLEPAEVCDVNGLGVVLGASCQAFGFWSGTLQCSADCMGVNASGCTNCGNSVIDAGELCDGPALGGESCETLGYATGTLACSADCLGYTGCEPYVGDCCFPQPGPGCGNPECAASVCDVDASCCSPMGTWGLVCVALATSPECGCP